MVKTCPKCGTKNFDDEKYCIKCAEKIKDVKPEPETLQLNKTDKFEDEFHGLKPRGYKPQPWQGRIYSKLGLFFIVLYFILFFTVPIYIILFITSIIAVVLGKLAISNGDTYIGKFILAISVIIFLLTLVLFITEIILY